MAQLVEHNLAKVGVAGSKMCIRDRNEVVAEQAGTIASINVEKGAMVNPGDTLFTLA